VKRFGKKKGKRFVPNFQLVMEKDDPTQFHKPEYLTKIKFRILSSWGS